MGAIAATKRDALTQIIEAQPASEVAAKARYDLGGLHLAGGNHERATTTFRQVPSAWPRWHSRAGLAIARIYDQQVQDVEAAAREYRKVIRVHPDSFPAAEGYARLADIYEELGDPVSSENMRDCAKHKYERLLDTSEERDERDAVLRRYVDTCRRLEAWDQATEALIRARRLAMRRKDTAGRLDLDRQLGLLYLDREQYGNALLRFRACLQHLRRRGDDVPLVVELSELVARCQRETSDDAGMKRTYRALLDFVRRTKERRDEVAHDPGFAEILARAYVVLDKATEARHFRATLRRMKGARTKEAAAAVDAVLGAAGA